LSIVTCPLAPNTRRPNCRFWQSFSAEVRDDTNQVMNDAPIDSIPADRVSPLLRCLQACPGSLTAAGDPFKAQAIQDKST
jgi:hypothetical protein